MTLSGWTAKIVDAKGELSSIKTSVAEREAYYSGQEEVINAQSVEGNIHLKAIDFEITAAKQRVSDLQIKIKSLNLSIYELSADFDNARASFMPEVEEHEREVESVRSQIPILQNEIATLKGQLAARQEELSKAEARIKIVQTETDKKLSILSEKETEIMAKRNALAREEQSMAEMRHYNSSAQSLYDIQ